MSLSLTSFCILDKDSQKAKFAFMLANYSDVSTHKISKSFRFAGHFWKLQITKKNGYFGMFLRWYGTDRGRDQSHVKFSCATSLIFSVLNKITPAESVSEGTRKEKDVFDYLKGGIGYGRIIKLNDLENTTGYLINNKLFLQVLIKVNSTTYHDKLICCRQEGRDFIQGLKFPFYGTTWYVLLFPDGENPDAVQDDTLPDYLQEMKDNEADGKENNNVNDKLADNKEDIEVDQVDNKSKLACIYLKRDVDPSRNTLRHDVRFMISVEGGGDVELEQHFYNRDSNAYGTASFMTVPKLKKICKSGTLKVKIQFKQVLPYFYFAYNIINEGQKGLRFGDGFQFKGHYNFPWLFRLIDNNSSGCVQGSITLDPRGNDKKVKQFSDKKKLLQLCWFVELLSPVDIEKSITFQPRGRRPLQEATLSCSKETDLLTFPIMLDQVTIRCLFYF